MKGQVTVIGHSGGCPDSVDLARFAAGMLEPDASEKVMRHISGCPDCSGRLRLITNPDEDDLTPDELSVINNLPSARPAGRAALAKKMGVRQRPLFVPAMQIAAAIACVGIAVGGFWYARLNRPASHDQTIASAYSSHRPFAFRLSANGNPGPIRIQRSSYAPTSLPSELVNALATLDAEVSRKPNDPKLLNASGEAKLLALDLVDATQALERARQLDPANERIATNLATALALQSESVEAGEPNRPLLLRSLQLLDASLRQQPLDTVARFNRALVLSALGRDRDAAAEFRRCLANETNPAWREEIAQRLKALPQ